MNEPLKDFIFPLSSGQVAILKICYPIEESDFNLLMETLHLWQPALVKPDNSEIELKKESCLSRE